MTPYSEVFDEEKRYAYLAEAMNKPCPAAATILAREIEKKHPGSTIMLYGSGISIMKNSDVRDVLYDFYVIVPSYKLSLKSKLLGLVNYLIPPNVYYIEYMSALATQTSDGVGDDEKPRKLRAKYAVLSISHLEKLVSKKTFHSYFWGRFAQPIRIVHCNGEMQDRIIRCVQTAIDVFIDRSKPLMFLNEAQANAIPDNGEGIIQDVWKAGLGRSYRAELRAEAPNRVDKLLEQYGDWPERVTRPMHDILSLKDKAKATDMAWRLRAFQGGVLSALRLLKGTFTFEGGIDYIVWKVSRHAGFDVPVRDWERRWPFFGTMVLGRRYYRMKKEHKKKEHKSKEDNGL